MKVVFTQHPFDSKGNVDRLGDRLIAQLQSGLFTRLIVHVAFAARSGTSRLYEALLGFNQSDRSTEVYVGINNDVTTAQALEQLLSSGSAVYAMDSQSILFHPKTYLLLGNTAWLSIGSSNLTAGGLFRNLETNVVCEYDTLSEGDKQHLACIADWPTYLKSIGADLFAVQAADLQQLIDEGRLVDERVKKASSSPGAPKAAKSGPQLKIPPLPPAATITGLLLSGSAKKSKVSLAVPSEAQASTISTAPVTQKSTPRYFAMTLSAFDCSHKSGTPGTPEIAIPESVASFFPAVTFQGRKYPDEYFVVELNKGALTRPVTYRIWQRPPGSGTGHADWRINIKHETMDLTSPAGDIILFERDFDDDEVPYKVWIVPPSDPRHAMLLANCTQETHAAGAAGIKRYGIFA